MSLLNIPVNKAGVVKMYLILKKINCDVSVTPNTIARRSGCRLFHIHDLSCFSQMLSRCSLLCICHCGNLLLFTIGKFHHLTNGAVQFLAYLLDRLHRYILFFPIQARMFPLIPVRYCISICFDYITISLGLISVTFDIFLI